MTQTLIKSPKVQRDALRSYYAQGIKPVDGRQPIPEELAQLLVQGLIDRGVKKDANIGVYDTFLILTLTLKEHGFNNITVLENIHSSLTSLQEKYYNTIQRACDKINVTYYVPPMNNYKRCDMKFDVIIGNPPYSDRSGNTSKSKDLDNKFMEVSTNISGYVKLIIRAKHFTNLKSKFRRTLFSSGHVKSITRLDDAIFPIQNTETCIVEWDETYTGPTKITYKDGTVVDRVLDKDTLIKLDNPDYVESVDNNLADRVIVGKLYRNKIQPGNQPMVELCGKDGPIITNVAPGLENTGRNCHGVIMNTCADWGSIGKLNIKPYDASICFSVTCLRTNTEEEAIQLLEYLQREDIKEIIKLNMTSFHPSKSLFAKIPSPF